MNQDAKPQVLVTGASGALGHAVTRSLRERGWAVRGFDIHPAQQAGEHVVGDLLDVEQLYAAADDIDILVHLAAVPDRDNFNEQLVPNNIMGTHNAFEVARLQRIKRVVYASSCRVVGGLDWSGEQIGLEAGLVPGDHYGVTKATGELIARMYSIRFGMVVTCARLGWFVRNEQEAARVETVASGARIYLSHRDACDFFDLALQAQAPDFSAVFVTSKNGGRALFDLEPTRQLFGFEPKDSWPEGSSWSSDLHFPSPRYAASLLPDPDPEEPGD